MIEAKKQDKKRVVDILTEAFRENKSVHYILKKPGQEKLIKNLIDYAFEICLRYGKVFLSEDQKGCACILFPDKRKGKFRAGWLDMRLILNCTGLAKISKVLHREKQIRALQATADNSIYYLWFIGVNPDYQNRGTGSALLGQIIAESGHTARRIFLETSTEKNIPWYEKNGFTVYARYDFGYTLYFLKR